LRQYFAKSSEFWRTAAQLGVDQLLLEGGHSVVVVVEQRRDLFPDAGPSAKPGLPPGTAHHTLPRVAAAGRQAGRALRLSNSSTRDTWPIRVGLEHPARLGRGQSRGGGHRAVPLAPRGTRQVHSPSAPFSALLLPTRIHAARVGHQAQGQAGQGRGIQEAHVRATEFHTMDAHSVAAEDTTKPWQSGQSSR
jgi:hypothetical protein